MAQELRSVKVTSGGLHDSPLRGGTIILRGVIDSGSLRSLLVDDYQREALPLTSLRKLTEALKNGESLPDIEVGMRGQKHRTHGEDWFLQDDCYIIDGQQRVNACLSAMSLQPGLPIYLGAAIHFSTDRVWERERFRILNSDRIKVSPNVIARNMREDHPGVDLIYKLSENDNFVLGHKISWDQNMKRTKLLTALNVMKVTGRLHSHLSPGYSTSLNEVAHQLDQLVERVTPSQVRENLNTFFNAVDEMWGIRSVAYRELAVHLHSGFLVMLGRFVSDHLDFWRGVNDTKLFIEKDLKVKMASFPLNDPSIGPLTSSAGASLNLLYEMLVKHVNSGKRTKHLQVRPARCNDSDSQETAE